MPVFEYKCTSCESTYDIYHKVRERFEDILCPQCGSPEHKRLISAPQVSMSPSFSSSYSPSPAPSCDSGGCCGGSCSVN